MLTQGQRVTLLTIDSVMAMTQRYELEVRRALDPQAVGYQNSRQRVAIVRQRGRRKDQYLDLAVDDILLDGWDLPFMADTEGDGVMSGNACFNLIGQPATIRELIKTRAVRPVPDSAKAKILVSRSVRTTCDDSGTELLYPEIDRHHAVVNRFKEARAAR
jgi:hypothetical protein